MEIKILNNPLSLGLPATDTEEEFNSPLLCCSVNRTSLFDPVVLLKG